MGSYRIESHCPHREQVSKLSSGLTLICRRVQLGLLAGVITICTPSASSGQDHYFTVRSIDNGTLTYDCWDFKGKKTLDISDMTVWGGVQDRDDVFHTSYTDELFRLRLLRGGYAKLNDERKGSPDERQAEDDARRAKNGMWASEPSVSPTASRRISGTVTAGKVLGRAVWGSIWRVILAFWHWIVTAAIAIPLFTWLIKCFYLNRQIELLIIGERDSGKTALCHVLEDPSIPKAKLLAIEHSKAVEKRRGPRKIPRGKFELLPVMTDIPGTDFSTVWDKVHGSRWARLIGLIRKYALIVVLAPGGSNGTGADGGLVAKRSVTEGVDQAYLNRQLGYVEAYIGGSIGSKRARRPRIVVFFLNKFDWFSDNGPNDSASISAHRDFEKAFANHIDLLQTASLKRHVPTKVIIGSAVEKWETASLLDAVVHQLYEA